MPAKDHFHNTVIRCLTKAGWTVSSQQVLYYVQKRRVWIDLRAEKPTENLSILIEIKGFEAMVSPVDYLASVVGQINLYQSVLKETGDSSPLYLAVPDKAYNGILGERIGQLVIRDHAINLLVFDAKREEIIKWEPEP